MLRRTVGLPPKFQLVVSKIGHGLASRGQPGHEVETVLTAAKEGNFDLLGFVGHSNVFGRVMGSTTQNISRLSPCSVLIVK